MSCGSGATRPVFSRDHAERALRGSGVHIPPVDTGMLDLCRRHLTAADFL